MTECKSVSTPLCTTESVPSTLYRSIIGSLLYLIALKPKIMYSVGLVARFQSNPRLSHLQAAKRILRYVKGTISYGLHYIFSSALPITAFSDADWGGSLPDRKKAEYIAASQAGSQLLWMHTTLANLGLHFSGPPKLYCDNQSAIAISKNPTLHWKSKHIDIKKKRLRWHGGKEGQGEKELEKGLKEETKQPFIWVLRDMFVGETRRAQLPKGFEERVEGKGMVVKDWAPQLQILGHESIRGFMSYCGWNSCMESISMGVPIAAWPVHSNQLRNTILVIKLLKVGLVVNDWARRDELVSSSTVEIDMKRLLVSKEGVDLRKRVVEMSGAVKQLVEEGDVSRMELDSFVAHITRS
ncbi:UDP-glycosyltransferase 76E1-like [Cornus florida]|uniref:UDP-glycosyltransferase 76E1-like n=1 Tax=Cornus florida TaxID=4283 RepID=UPI002898E8C4|nr:UDP-glycosyltransferase 76E1-like [Cornus florida]